MYEGFAKSPMLHSPEKVSEKHLSEIKKELSELAPDFVEVVEKFGRVNVADSFFVIYGWIDDLATFFADMGFNVPDVNAWVFGDNFSGDFYGFEKKSGNIISVNAGDLFEHEYDDKSFEEFITNMFQALSTQ